MSQYEEQVVALANTLFAKGDAASWALDEPQIWESFGEQLSPQLSTLGVERIITWDQLHSTVLGHVVARNIGAKVTTAYAEDGLLGIEHQGSGVEKAVLLDVDWPDHPPASALFSFAESQGYQVVGLISVLRGKYLNDIDSAKIIQLEQA